MLITQAGTEWRLALRHPEQAFLTLFVPVVLLVGLTWVRVVPLPEPRIGSVAPSILVLAVISTAFTSQAIALGFDRRYGVIARLAATAIPRWLLITGRLTAMLGVVAVQLVVLCAFATLLGWRPDPSGVGWALLLLGLGSAAFGSLGLLLGGSVRAELTLAIANIVWFVLLFVGGILIPLDDLPALIATVGAYLPSGVLSLALHSALNTGRAPAPQHVAVLLGWTTAACALAIRTVKLR
jgi:ABC-2 type transport system permease protein